MTKTEIQGMINSKIKGQGSAIDVGGALASILEGVLNSFATLVEVDDFEEFDKATAYEVGDIVRKGGVLKKFTSEHSAGDEWDEEEVTGTNIFSILTSLISTKQDKLVSIGKITGIGEVTFTATTPIELLISRGGVVGKYLIAPSGSMVSLEEASIEGVTISGSNGVISVMHSEAGNDDYILIGKATIA